MGKEKKSEKKQEKYEKEEKAAFKEKLAEESKRLRRISGQLEGIGKMLESKRKLPEVLTQFKAVHSALRSIEGRVFEAYAARAVSDIIEAEKRKEREAKLEELKELYSMSV